MNGTPGTTPRRGLVIGAGAALGGAWALGVLSVLGEQEGFDPTASDVVVGTSAGSVLAALIGYGVPPEVMAERLNGGAEEVEGTEPVNPLDLPDHVHRVLSDVPLPLLLPGNLALAARTLSRPGRHTAMTLAAAMAPRGRGSLAPLGELIEETAAGRDWPARPRTWIVAVDFRSGRRVVFGRPGAPEVPLPQAVMASCAAPGYFPPVPIRGRRYVDGGAFSVTNADLLLREPLDEILVLAPMAMYETDRPRTAAARLERQFRRHVTRRLNTEVGRLAATARVRVFSPTAADLAVIGSNVMDARRRRLVYDTALTTTTARLRSGRPSDEPQWPEGREAS